MIRTLLAAVAVITFALASSTAVSGASPVPPDADWASPEEVLRGDAADYAASYGVSTSEALRRIELITQAGALEEVLAEYQADSYAGAWVEHEPDFRVVVSVTRDVKPLEAHYVTGTALDSVTTFRTVEHTLAELERDLLAVRSREPTVPFDMNIDVKSNSVEVLARAESDFSAYTRRHEIAPPQSVTVRVVPELSAPAADIYAGLSLSACTSGFSVADGDTGARGILTAGHCTNTISYLGSGLPYQSGAHTGSHDEQWHTAPGFVVRNQMRINAAGDRRNVLCRTTRANQPIGSTVHKYGKSTGATFGTLQSKSYAPNWVPNANPTFMHVTKNNAVLVSGGDSGGPVYYGNCAYGIVSGSLTWPDGDVSLVYTATDFVQAGLDVLILIAP